MFSSFFFYDDADPRELHVLTHSFPTRRASDLKGDPRPLQAAGAYWEYNDVRINQLALALLHLFQQPLPDVFREAIMRPVGATENWQWVGRSEEHTSELQSLMRISYDVFCLKKKTESIHKHNIRSMKEVL